MQAEQNKDPTERQMAKIAREAAKFTVQMMKADGIGTAEFDFIHLVRHNPGMTIQSCILRPLPVLTSFL